MGKGQQDTKAHLPCYHLHRGTLLLPAGLPRPRSGFANLETALVFQHHSTKLWSSLSLLRNTTSSYATTCTSQLTFNSRPTASPVSWHITSTTVRQVLTMCWIFHEYWACGHPSDHHQVFEKKCTLYLIMQANDDTAYYRQGLKPSAIAALSQCPGNNVTHHFMWDGPFTEEKCWLCTATDTSLIPYGCIIPAHLSQNIPMASILRRGIEPVERPPANQGKYRLPPIPTNSRQQREIQTVYATQDLAVAARVGHWLEDLPSLTNTPKRSITEQQIICENGIVTPTQMALAAAKHEPQVSHQPISQQEMPPVSHEAMESQGQSSQDSLPVWAGPPAPNSHLHHIEPHQQRYGMLEHQNLLSVGRLLPQPQMQPSFDPKYSAQPRFASIDPTQATQWTTIPTTFDMNEARRRARAEAEALYRARARAYHLAQVQALAASQTFGPMLSEQPQAELGDPSQMSLTSHPNMRWQNNPAPAVYLTSPANFGNVPSSKHSPRSPPGSPRCIKARAKRLKRQSPTPKQSSHANDSARRCASARRSLRNRPKISYNEQSSSDENEAEEDAKPDNCFTPFSTSSSHPTRSVLDQTPTDFPQTPTMPPRRSLPRASLLADPQEYSPFASQQSPWGY